MRTLAIGDIHGCHTALTTLLQMVKPTPADKIIFLGDYVDRGPASRQVIETLLELKQSCSCVFLRGNHEVMMLEARTNFDTSATFKGFGGWQTLHSYDVHFHENWASLIPPTHWEFLEGTGKFHETENEIFVHGCVSPDLEMADQPEDVLYWETFDQLKPHKSGKRIICGHTPQRSHQPENKGFGVCIDTGAVYRGWLTCLDTTANSYWQTNEKGETREGHLDSLEK